MSLRYLSISQLSEVTGKDRRTVSKRLSGIEPHSLKGNAQLYDSARAVELICAAESVAGMDKQLLKAELGVEVARQAKMEIEVGKLRGELVPLGDVAKAVEKEYSFVRAQFRSIPSKLAKPLSMISDPNEVHLRLHEAVDECLAELTADVKYDELNRKFESARSAADPVPEIDHDPGAEVDASGMGRQPEISESGIE